MKYLIYKSLIALSSAFSLQAIAISIDSASIEYGSGNDVEIIKVGAQWDWQKQWLESNGTHLGGYWDISAANWKSLGFQKVSLTDFGITPVFRFQNNTKMGIYAEIGVGFHFFSEIYRQEDRKFSTKFQFGDHIGVGYKTRNGWDVALKVQHYSNAGIKQPNPGVTAGMVKAAYSF
jgi:lipid A 3-O-deacylase